MALFHRISLSVIPLLLLAACSSNDDGTLENNLNTPDGGTPDAASNDVVVVSFNRWGFKDGNPIEVPSKWIKFAGASAIATVNGAPQTFAGTVRADGSVLIPNVPPGPYVLEMRTTGTDQPADELPMVMRYPIEDGARRVRRGEDYWARPAEAMTPSTKLALSITTPALFLDSDTFSWLSVSSYFLRDTAFWLTEDGTVEGQANVPEFEATTCQNWTTDGEYLGMPYGEDASGLPGAGDDLMVMQTRSTLLDTGAGRFNPWWRPTLRHPVAVLDSAGVTFTNGVTNTVTGTLSELQKQDFVIDFRGSTFAPLREAGKYPEKTVRSRAYVSLTQETGAPGTALYTSVAPESWSFQSRTTVKAAEGRDACFSAGGTCIPANCPVSCDEATAGYVDPGDLTYTIQAPHLYESGMRDIYYSTYTHYFEWKHPTVEDVTAILSAGATMIGPNAGPFTLSLGAARNLRVGETELPWDKTTDLSAEAARTIRFDAPQEGKADFYDVEVQELAPDAGKDLAASRAMRLVAKVFSRTPSATIPEGVFRAGRFYFVRVIANQREIDFTDGLATKSETQLKTSVMSAPFRITD